jgi:hypothetical protein
MPKYKLTAAQFKRLRIAMTGIYINEDLLSGFLDDELRQSLNELAGAGPLPERTRAVIKAAEANDWLIDLLDAGAANNAGETAFKEIRDELVAVAGAPSVDPFEAWRLGSDRVFIDRTPLRMRLKQMRLPLGKRILVVDGGKKTGKSHLKHFLTLLESSLADFRTVYVDLEQHANAISGPVHSESLGERIARQMGWPDGALGEPPEDHQRARWNLRFHDTLKARAGLDPQPWWIVLDSFSKVVLPQSTIDLVTQIATLVDESLPHYRLLLLSTRQGLLSGTNGHPPETVAPVSNEELMDFFFRVYEDAGIVPTPERVSAAVQRVLQHVDRSDPEHMAQLGPAAFDVTQALP